MDRKSASKNLHQIALKSSSKISNSQNQFSCENSKNQNFIQIEK